MERRAEESKTDNLGVLFWRRQQPEAKTAPSCWQGYRGEPYRVCQRIYELREELWHKYMRGDYFFYYLIQPHEQLQGTRSSAADSARSGEIRLLLDDVNHVRFRAAAFRFAKICIQKGVPSNKTTTFWKDSAHKNGCCTSKWTSAHFWGGTCSSMPVYNCRGRGGCIFVCKLSLITANLVC